MLVQIHTHLSVWISIRKRMRGSLLVDFVRVRGHISVSSACEKNKSQTKSQITYFRPLHITPLNITCNMLNLMYAGEKALLNPAQGHMSDTGQAEMGQLIWLPFVVTWGKWNVNSLVGMEPEQVREVKRSQLGIVGLTYLHNAGSGTEFSERWLTLSFFKVAQDERHRACVGTLVSPQLSAAVLGVLRGKQEGLLYANASCFRYSWTGSQVAAVEWRVSRLGTSELHLCFLLITSSAGFFGPWSPAGTGDVQLNVKQFGWVSAAEAMVLCQIRRMELRYLGVLLFTSDCKLEREMDRRGLVWHHKYLWLF